MCVYVRVCVCPCVHATVRVCAPVRVPVHVCVCAYNEMLGIDFVFSLSPYIYIYI